MNRSSSSFFSPPEVVAGEGTGSPQQGGETGRYPRGDTAPRADMNGVDPPLDPLRLGLILVELNLGDFSGLPVKQVSVAASRIAIAGGGDSGSSLLQRQALIGRVSLLQLGKHPVPGGVLPPLLRSLLPLGRGVVRGAFGLYPQQAVESVPIPPEGPRQPRQCHRQQEQGRIEAARNMEVIKEPESSRLRPNLQPVQKYLSVAGEPKEQSAEQDENQPQCRVTHQCLPPREASVPLVVTQEPTVYLHGLQEEALPVVDTGHFAGVGVDEAGSLLPRQHQLIGALRVGREPQAVQPEGVGKLLPRQLHEGGGW